MNKLNLGCGEFKKQGYVNLDHKAELKPDVVHDLNSFPYPFQDGYFDLIEADHIIEHLDDPFGAMRELCRITKKGGTIIMRVPHFSRGFTHPEHRCGFDVSFPYYFNPSFKGGYTGTELGLGRMKLSWLAQPYLKKTVLPRPVYYAGFMLGALIDFFANLSPLFCSKVWCFWVGGFEEIEFRFIRT